jgi:hypothetical protein
MYLGERGWDFVGWIHLAQNRGQWQALVNEVMVNFNFWWITLLLLMDVY